MLQLALPGIHYTSHRTLVYPHVALQCYAGAGVTVSTALDGGCTFTLDNGLTLPLGSSGASAVRSSSSSVQEQPDGTVIVSLDHGGSLTLRNGMGQVTLPGGDILQLYSNGDRAETVGGVTTTTFANGDVERIDGNQREFFNRSDMSLTTYQQGEMVKRVEYDGLTFRYENGHTYTDIAGGITLKDGMNPLYQVVDYYGRRTLGLLPILRTPWGKADSPEVQQGLAALAAGKHIACRQSLADLIDIPPGAINDDVRVFVYSVMCFLFPSHSGGGNRHLW